MIASACAVAGLGGGAAGAAAAAAASALSRAARTTAPTFSVRIVCTLSTGSVSCSLTAGMQTWRGLGWTLSGGDHGRGFGSGFGSGFESGWGFGNREADRKLEPKLHDGEGHAEPTNAASDEVDEIH